MKKITAILLAILLVLTCCLTGCKSEPSGSSDTINSLFNGQSAQTDEPVEDEPIEDEPVEDDSDDYELDEDGLIVTPAMSIVEKSEKGVRYPDYLYTRPSYKEGRAPKYEEQVLFDDFGVRLTLPAGELKCDSLGYYELPVVLENTRDSRIQIMTVGFSVNKKSMASVTSGIMGFADGNTTVETSIFFYQSDINRNEGRVCVPRDFDFSLMLFDMESGERLTVSEPVSFSTNADFDYEDTYEPYKLVFFDSANTRMRASRFYYDEGDMVLEFSIENRGQNPTRITVNNVLVNGVEINPKFGVIVIPGCTYMTTMRFKEEELSNNGLDFDTATVFGIEFVFTCLYDDQVIEDPGVLFLYTEDYFMDDTGTEIIPLFRLDGLSFEYPQDYVVLQDYLDPSSGMAFVGHDKDTKSKSVNVAKTTGVYMSLDDVDYEFMEGRKESITSGLEAQLGSGGAEITATMTIESVERIQINGADCVISDFVVDINSIYNDKNSTYILDYRQVIFIDGLQAYVVTFSVVDDASCTAEEYSQSFLESMRFE